MSMDVTMFRTFSQVIIMMQKVHTHTEKGAGIFIKESSIKVIDACRVLGKAQVIKTYGSKSAKLIVFTKFNNQGI